MSRRPVKAGLTVNDLIQALSRADPSAPLYVVGHEGASLCPLVAVAEVAMMSMTADGIDKKPGVMLLDEKDLHRICELSLGPSGSA